jgi:hypothetical protein
MSKEPAMATGLSTSTELPLSPSQVSEALRRHIAGHFDAARISEIGASFVAEHIVPLRDLCPVGLLAAIRAEANGLVERFGTRHEHVFAITDNTPRNIVTVGQPVIKDEGPLIDAFYFSPVLRDFIASVVGEQVHICPYPGEHYVVSRLGKSGDTHGWHWDDYTYGFILVLEAPHYTQGGFIQAVANTSWNKEDPDVYGALISSQVRSYALEPGDAYVIKTNTTMHRVQPIRGHDRRTIVNMTFASTADLSMSMTHETNDVLFGGVGDLGPGR